MTSARSRRPRRAVWLIAALLVASGCARHAIIDTMMSSAYRPAAAAQVSIEGIDATSVLAGDMHCHVSPPDHPSDVVRGLSETVGLARAEGLDFVVLTPHVPARFFADPVERDAVADSQRRLREQIAGTDHGGILLIPGMEYTDHRFGHLGLAFADLDSVLADVPLEVAQSRPEVFFERWVAHGGTIVVNHPLVTPLPSAPVAMARADLSWRPWTSAAPVPSEIAAAHRLAFGFEAFNLAASQLRDRYLLGNLGHTLLATLGRLDREILARRQRLTPVGGSDSHSHHLRAMTFVRAGRTPEAIRDALVGGRVCLRSPEACTLQIRAPRGRWQSVGGDVRATDHVEVRAGGDDARIVIDGRVVLDLDAGEVASYAIAPSRCTIVRASVGDGFSAPIYVNCPFGSSAPRDPAVR